MQPKLRASKSAVQLIKEYYWIPLTVACLILTRPFFFADTIDFSAHVVAREHGATAPFLEFGHLWWRPLGLLLDRTIGGFVAPIGPASDWARVSLEFILLSVFAYVITTLVFYNLSKRLGLSTGTASLITLILGCSAPLLNYSRAGAPYMVALMLLTLALYFALRDRSTRRADLLLAGVCAGLASAMWLPFLWGVPAILIARPIIHGADRWKDAAIITLIFGVVLLCIYAGAIVTLHIYTPAAFAQWRTHGPDIPVLTGFQRMLFGLPKTLLYLGKEGVQIKRFLTHDPYNPVSFVELITTILWKLAFFMLGFAMLVVLLWRTQNGSRRVLLLLVSLIPNVAFAITFNGSDPERFMPFLPVLWLSMAYALDAGARSVRLGFWALAIVVLLTNVSGMWYSQYHDEETSLEDQLRFTRQPTRSLIVIPNIQDKVNMFLRNHPLHELSWSDNIAVIDVIKSERDTRTNWIEHVKAAVRDSLQPREAVWIAKELTLPAPDRSVYWVEANSSVPWRNIYEFFSQLHRIDSTAGYYEVAPGALQ